MKNILFLVLLLPILSFGQLQIHNTSNPDFNGFTVASQKEVAQIYVDASEDILLKKTANFLANDIEMVSSKQPEIVKSAKQLKDNVIIIATVGNNPLIEDLVANNKIEVSTIKGEWERFIIKTVKNPFPNVDQALVILGSDRRGAAYGSFTLSKEMGVSPWYWWADVPVIKQPEIHVAPCDYISKSPAVKYRGIFINDESPAFRNWAKETFGGINHKCYEKIFELLLRNKANYLWPSMWLPTMFYVDDPLNAKTAHDFGIVMSTSHHEPLTRAHNEWYVSGEGDWNYETNKEKLHEFWRGGVERIKDFETVLTVGMRGDGDAELTEETAVDLLQTIIKDQREIIADVTKKPAEETPQVWAIYKEVQDYYDKGMRVADDITILFSDDNWGNIRYLPKKEDLNHKGGYGMYYHFDYVGAPVSYRWLNVTQIERVWEQMQTTYDHGVKDLWIANVGDIKPMELPISFFMDFAWDPSSITAKDLPKFYQQWSAQQFGPTYAEEIASFLALYTKYNARRTAEMLTKNTYSVANYREADRIVNEYNALLEKSTAVYNKLDDQYKAAYYQLVQSPIELSSNINEMYVAAGKNEYYGIHGAVSANYYAKRVKELFEKDAELTQKFHNLKDGKWNHMMSQTHIGYTYWNHPPLNMMPAVSYVQPVEGAELGFLLEHGERPLWGWLDVEADWSFSEALPVFDPVNDQSYYIDVINRGNKALSYHLKANTDWIKLSSTYGETLYNEKVYVSIDWSKAPKNQAEGTITISGAGDSYTITVPINNSVNKASGFVENEGVIAINADNFSNKTDSEDVSWTLVPNLGRTNGSLIVQPTTAKIDALNEHTPQVEYKFTTFSTGDVEISTLVSPTQDFKKAGGLKFAIAIDDETPQIININEGEIIPDYKYGEWWEQSVADHIKSSLSKHHIKEAGTHTLKIWPVTTGIVFQKFIINLGGLKDSYLGPAESKFVD